MKKTSVRGKEEKKERERGEKKGKKCDCTPRTTSWIFPWWTLAITMAKCLETAVLFHKKKCFEGRTKEVWAFGRSLKITVFRSSAGVNQDNSSIATVVKNWLTLPSIMAFCYGGIFLYSLDRGRNCFYCMVHVFLLRKHFLSLIA